jgi:hypothetical protein
MREAIENLIVANMARSEYLKKQQSLEVHIGYRQGILIGEEGSLESQILSQQAILDAPDKHKRGQPP